jgi:DNA-binding response OmpR family regulator
MEAKTQRCDIVRMSEKKILVIDDEWAIRFLLESQLRRAGFTVYAMPGGSDALALLPTFEPDLVILDIMMPDMDGFEVCRCIRCHPCAAGTPIIFLSGSTTKEHRRLAFESGGDDFLVKPFQKEELLARIEALFRRRGQTIRQSGEQNGKVVSDSQLPAASGRMEGTPPILADNSHLQWLSRAMDRLT